MKLTHPDSKTTVEVSDDAAEAYISQGWVEQTGKEKPRAAKSADD
jgi:hypothetical protein